MRIILYSILLRAVPNILSNVIYLNGIRINIRNNSQYSIMLMKDLLLDFLLVCII